MPQVKEKTSVSHSLLCHWETKQRQAGCSKTAGHKVFFFCFFFSPSRRIGDGKGTHGSY